MFARPFALALSEALGVLIIIIENIGGAASRIGTQRVTSSAADGYILLLSNAPRVTLERAQQLAAAWGARLEELLATDAVASA